MRRKTVRHNQGAAVGDRAALLYDRSRSVADTGSGARDKLRQASPH